MSERHSGLEILLSLSEIKTDVANIRIMTDKLFSAGTITR